MAKTLKQNLLAYYRDTKSIYSNINAIMNTENYNVIFGEDHGGKIQTIGDIVYERLRLLESICYENKLIGSEEIFKQK